MLAGNQPAGAGGWPEGEFCACLVEQVSISSSKNKTVLPQYAACENMSKEAAGCNNKLRRNINSQAAELPLGDIC